MRLLTLRSSTAALLGIVLGAFLLGATAQPAAAAEKPVIGPLKTELRHGFMDTTKVLSVDVTGAQRVVFWINGRKHEADPRKKADCGDVPCRTWSEWFYRFRSEPIPYFSFKIVASNSAGTTKVAGFRCHKGPFCFPYTVKCSPLDSGKWKRLSTDDLQPLGSPLWFYARGIAKCGSLIGLTRDELYKGLGEPDADSKNWASWYIWSDFGDVRSLETTMRQGRVVGVHGPF